MSVGGIRSADLDEQEAAAVAALQVRRAGLVVTYALDYNSLVKRVRDTSSLLVERVATP